MTIEEQNAEHNAQLKRIADNLASIAVLQALSIETTVTIFHGGQMQYEERKEIRKQAALIIGEMTENNYR